MNISWLKDLFVPNRIKALESRRQRVLEQHQDLPEPIKALFSAPLPALNRSLDSLDLIGIDIETTGFSPESDQILSVGYLFLTTKRIDLSSSVSEFVQTSTQLKRESAAVNQIDKQTLSGGRELDEVMMPLLAAMAHRTPVAHGSFMEQGFIAAYLKKRYGLADCPLLWIDTLRLYKSIQQGSVRIDARLGSARDKLGLPEYMAHNALFDAVACSELLLVLIKKIYRTKSPTIKQLLERQ